VDVRLMSAPEVAAELGSRIRRERLRRDLTPETLAQRSGLSRPTIARMEAGRSSTLRNFLSVLIALGRAGDLEEVLQPPPARTLVEFLGEEPTRKRGRR
jgi:transcriptional regulator with XRE-family HTH domain